MQEQLFACSAFTPRSELAVFALQLEDADSHGEGMVARTQWTRVIAMVTTRTYHTP